MLQMVHAGRRGLPGKIHAIEPPRARKRVSSAESV
jgi:hypothetical protein